MQTLAPDPVPAKQDAALNRGNRVSTDDQSAAQVTFRDESQIELGEKTLVVILGDMRANAAKTTNVGDTTLVTGSLRSKLGQLSGTSRPPIIATEGAESLVAKAIGADRKGIWSVVLYAVAIPLAFVSQWIAQLIYVAVALMWLVPDRRIVRVLGA